MCELANCKFAVGECGRPRCRGEVDLVHSVGAGGLSRARNEAPLLREMPVTMVLNDDSGIIGTARYTLIEKAFRTQKRVS